MSCIELISKELEQLGYLTSIIYEKDNIILLFYRESENTTVIFGVSQSNSSQDISIGNIIIYDSRPTLVYNSILREDTYSFNTLLKAVKAIESGINKNYNEDYISNDMLLREKFKSPDRIIKLFISINNYSL